MAWVVLILSGALEAVWATALAASSGFRRTRPLVVFLVALTLSMAGLAWAMSHLPAATAYAVWVGVGAGLTVTWSIVRGHERPTRARVALLTLLIVSVIGLKVVA